MKGLQGKYFNQGRKEEVLSSYYVHLLKILEVYVSMAGVTKSSEIWSYIAREISDQRALLLYR